MQDVQKRRSAAAASPETDCAAIMADVDAIIPRGPNGMRCQSTSN